MDSKSTIRPCGSTWEYCDGVCAGCAKSRITTSNKTDDKNEIPLDLQPDPQPSVFCYW